jgi:glycosyltransferase involved in cell wall biosynthesis
MPYLPATLESIAAQTYPHHKLIAWDNGSTDGTLELLRQWIPYRIPGRIVHDRPLRLGPTMAALVEMADTELCAVIHGDDINFPSRLAQQVAFMNANPQAGVVGGQIEVIDEHGTIQNTGPYWKYETDDASVRWRLRWQAQFCHPAVMLRRAAVLQAGNYRDLQPFEDLDLWQRMANCSELWNLPDKVLQYRRTTTSSTGTIVQYLPLERRAASLNSDLLFPGLANEARVMDLWEATHPYYLENPSKFRHIFEIQRAATNLAKKLGKPADYFLKTELFLLQQDTLKKRFYARVGLTPLATLRQRILHPGHN